MVQQVVDELGDKEDTKHTADCKRNQNIKLLYHSRNIKYTEGINKGFYGVNDTEIISEYHQNQGAADTGDDHRGCSDDTHKKKLNHDTGTYGKRNTAFPVSVIAMARKIKNTSMFTSRECFASFFQPSRRECTIAGIPPTISPVKAMDVAKG